MVERTLISFPSQLQLIERLQHLLYLSSSMVFISGEQGSGKSTLIEQLSNQLPDKTQQAFISIAELTSVAQIRQQIITQLFDLPLFDADDSLSNILLLLKDKKAGNVARVIVIDNAHLLPQELLIELAEVIQQKISLTDNELNFILLSDESSNKQMIDALKSSTHVRGVATLTFKLAPLNIDEATQLLNHHFSQIGYSPQLEHQDALHKQLLSCQGIPEKILLLASQLNSGVLDNHKASWLTTRLPAILLMLLLVTIATALGFYLYPQFVKNKQEVETIIETEAVLLEEIKATDIITDELNASESNDIVAEVLSSPEARNIDAEELSVSEPSNIFAGQWSNRKQAVTDNQLSVGDTDSKERVTISEMALFEIGLPKRRQTTLIEDKNINYAPLLVEIEPANEIDKKFEVIEKLAKPLIVKLPDKPENPNIEIVESLVLDKEDLEVTEVTEVTEVKEKIVNELIVTSKKVEPEVAILQGVQELEGVPEVQRLETLQSEPRDVFTAVDSLLAVKANLYTLQLSGMSTEKSLQAFINVHKLPRKNVYLYKTIRNQKPWYVVIYGQFESRVAASRVAENLPTTLRQLDSWVKKYASVHQDLQLNEQ